MRRRRPAPGHPAVRVIRLPVLSGCQCYPADWAASAGPAARRRPGTSVSVIRRCPVLIRPRLRQSLSARDGGPRGPGQAGQLVRGQRQRDLDDAFRLAAEPFGEADEQAREPLRAVGDRADAQHRLGVPPAEHHDAAVVEPLADRGDGILVLIKPHDEVSKTVLLERLIPLLATLLAEYNAQVAQSALRMRLRAVAHAGEVHMDKRGC